MAAAAEFSRQDVAEVDLGVVRAARVEALGDGPQRARRFERRGQAHAAAPHQKLAAFQARREVRVSPYERQHGLGRQTDLALGRRKVQDARVRRRLGEREPVVVVVLRRRRDRQEERGVARPAAGLGRPSAEPKTSRCL